MTNTEVSLMDSVTIGIIQTTLDARAAWNESSDPKIGIREDNRAWHEIRRAMKALRDQDDQPQIVLLPELALPRTRLDDFQRLVCSMNVLAIVGVDYRLDHTANSAKNEGLVLVPRNIWRKRPSRYASRIWFGKHTAAPAESDGLKKYSPPWSFNGDENVYAFDAGPFGRFGVAICYDFMDIERALLYRGRVHHLIVLAYNRDIKMFESLAVSLSRTVYCNVIVCNTGYYGGSLLVSPFYEAHKRIGYSIDGGSLFSAQSVTLPIQGLDDAIHGRSDPKNYKHLPPGFKVVI
ncbi:carbon-nitrogen hydrolase family protein [Herbaspirillum sp. WGmk3]|uniref:carbon-nitrogen hydrolase family protein n=1 Tax=Herbaspirillum sp. WGmk3 TaxID=2919925 RepID=UPI002090D967|nr:carbon-nitrogen hydrolase family protein [Herbaspirillum sp. WGmk3]MCO4856497.1 carbon-nitrogen hydrolase family protein [Herbaspirillum sp. WGmk3]